MLVGEHTITDCIVFLNRTENAGAVGVKMIDGSGAFLQESKRGFPSPATSLFKLAGLSRLFPHSKTFSNYHLGHLNENEDHAVDVLAGAFIMVRKQVLDKTGGFDESFFMYGEDIDLSFRIQQAGFKNYYLANPIIIHFKGESTKKNSKAFIQQFYGAMNIFVNKHYSGFRVKWYSLLINAITGFKMAGLKSREKRKLLITKPEKQYMDNTIIIGSFEEYEIVLSIIRSAKIGAKIIGRVTPQYIDASTNIGHIDNLELILKNYEVKEIIFCEGVTSYDKIIETIQTIPQTVKKKFYSAGLSSIISSDDKNFSGDVISPRIEI